MDVMGVNLVTTAAGSVDLAVAGVVVLYTKAIYVGCSKFHALSYSAVSATGAIALKIEVEQSYKLPDTEGAADGAYSEPENMPDVAGNLTVESTTYHKSLALIPLPYMRLKITGLAGNSADAIVTARLTKQELA